MNAIKYFEKADGSHKITKICADSGKMLKYSQIYLSVLTGIEKIKWDNYSKILKE